MPEVEAVSHIAVSVADLPSVLGRSFGPSSWRSVSQEEVGRFADLSGDHNPIHVDAEAAARSPFGGTIVHGYLTLSLVVPLLDEIFEVTGASMGLNYGLNKVRFPAPVPVGSRVRLTGEIAKVDEIEGGYQIAPVVTFRSDRGTKPVCVAEMLLRYYR